MGAADPPHLYGIGDELGAIFEVQPLQNLADMIFDGAFAEAERLSHLFVSKPLGSQRQDFPLARREHRRSRRAYRGSRRSVRLAGKFTRLGTAAGPAPTTIESGR